MAAPNRQGDVFTVSALAARVHDLLEDEFPSVWVGGELTGFVRHSSGHMYFSLKDANAQLRAVMFRGSNIRLRFEPRDGLEVLARGKISFYSTRGDCQLYVEEMQPKGVGAAELALRQLKEKLSSRGYFLPGRKRPLPRFPQRIAVVTSPTGAAIRDMLELFAQRWPLAEIIVRPSRVQGATAAAEIAAAVRMLNQVHTNGQLRLDAIIVGRGGGSAEDLSAFNEEIVADAIFQSVVPVVSAVGHEIDVTIADLVADSRAETPSAAVAAMTPHRAELAARFASDFARLQDGVEHRLALARRSLDQLAARPVLRRPLQRIRDYEQRLDDTAGRLQRAATRRLTTATEKLAAVAAQLETLSPLNVLSRGYSLTRTTDGQLIRSATEVQVGDELVSRVAAGEIVSRVEKVQDSIQG